MEKSKDKYHIEMRFNRIIGCGWIALCTVGLISRCVICADASRVGKQIMRSEVNHTKVSSNV